MSYESEEDEISALWNAAIQRREEEDSSEEIKQPIEHGGLKTAQEISFVCLDGRARKPCRGAIDDDDYDYMWNEDGVLVFSKELERGSRIDCWLGFEKKGSITRLHYLSHLTDSTEAHEPIVCFGSWQWSREMCKGKGGYNIVRNFLGEDDGIPAIKKSIDNSDSGISDEERFDNAWAKLALSELGDKDERNECSDGSTTRNSTEGMDLVREPKDSRG